MVLMFLPATTTPASPSAKTSSYQFALSSLPSSSLYKYLHANNPYTEKGWMPQIRPDGRQDRRTLVLYGPWGYR